MQFNFEQRYSSGESASTSVLGAIYSEALSSQTEVTAIVIGMYLRAKATSLLEEDTDRMCVLLNGEYGNLLPGLFFSGLSGDIVAQDLVWSAQEAISPMVPQWEETTGMTLSSVLSSLVNQLGPFQMGSWLSYLAISSPSCSICTETGTWSDIALPEASSVV